MYARPGSNHTGTALPYCVMVLRSRSRTAHCTAVGALNPASPPSPSNQAPPLACPPRPAPSQYTEYTASPRSRRCAPPVPMPHPVRKCALCAPSVRGGRRGRGASTRTVGGRRKGSGTFALKAAHVGSSVTATGWSCEILNSIPPGPSKLSSLPHTSWMACYLTDPRPSLLFTPL